MNLIVGKKWIVLVVGAVAILGAIALILAVWSGASQPLAVVAPGDGSGPWVETAVDATAFTPIAERTLPAGAHLLGWLPDGRLAAWKEDRLWLVAMGDAPVEEITLERPLVRDLWQTRFTHSMGALVFDWDVGRKRFIAVADMPAKNDGEDYASQPQLTEFDGVTGELLRTWTDGELGGTPWKTRYVAGGDAIAAGVWGGDLPSMHQGWSVGWELFFFMTSEYHASPGAPVVVAWNDGRIDRLPADVGDLTFRGGTPYVVGTDPGTRLSILGKTLWKKESGYSIARVRLADQVIAVTEECVLASSVVFVPSPGASPGEVYLSHTYGGGGTASTTTVVRYDSATKNLDHLLALTSPDDARSNPVWLTAVGGRGLFVSTTPNGEWSFKCYRLDESRQSIALESIVPEESDVRFSRDGQHMAVLGRDGDLRVYAMEELFASAPPASTDGRR